VIVVFETSIAPDRIQPRSDAATCGFCREHDGVWVSDPVGMLRVATDDGTRVQRFASEAVAFHFCPACGVLVYALFRDEASPPVGIARVGLFESLRAVAPPPIVTCFEGELPETGRRRRIERWTPVSWG
jgi:hypothetical protein